MWEEQENKKQNKTKKQMKKPGEVNFNNVFYVTQYTWNLTILTSN